MPDFDYGNTTSGTNPTPVFTGGGFDYEHPISAPNYQEIGSAVLQGFADEDPVTYTKRKELAERYTPEQVGRMLAERPEENFGSVLQMSRRMDLAYELVKGEKPDRATERRIYANMYNVPEDYVEQNFDMFRDKLAAADSKAFLAGSSRLSAWAADPRNLAVAKDSLKHLSVLEGKLVSRYGTVSERAKINLGNLFKSTFSGLAGAGRATLEGVAELSDAPFTLAEWATGNDYSRDREQNPLNSALRISAQTLADVAQKASSDYVPFTNEIGALESAGHQVTSGVTQMGASLALGMLNPAVPVAIIGAMEGGVVYNDLRDQQVSVGRALLTAAPVGVVNAALEKLQIQSVGKLAGLDSFGKLAVREVAGTLLENVAQETAQNVVSEMGTAIGASSVTNVDYADRLKGALAGGLQEGLTAAVSALILSSPNMLRSYGHYRTSLKQARDIHESMGVAADMPLRQRSPELAKEAMDATTTAGRASIDPAILNAYAQVNYGEDAPRFVQSLTQKLGITPQQIEEANRVGGEVDFEKTAWLAHLSGTPDGSKLHDSVRWGEHTPAELPAVKAKFLEEIGALYEVAEQLTGKEPVLPEQWKGIRQALMDHGNTAAGADAIMATLSRFASFAERTTGAVPERFQNLELVFDDTAGAVSIPADRVATPQPVVSTHETAYDPFTDLAIMDKQEWASMEISRKIDGQEYRAKAGDYVKELVRERNNLQALLACVESGA